LLYLMDRQLFGQAASGLALFLALACTAHAGSFVVHPVRVTLTAAQSVSALTVRNDGVEPAVIQLEAVRWSQRNGEDVLEKTNEILATPPIFTVPPGGTQIIRVGLRRAPDSQQELTFRLFLQEIPPPKPVAQGLRVALRVSLPVFVAPATATSPKLEWRAFRKPDGNIRLLASNSGTAHVQISALSLTPSDGGKTLATKEISEYVLPRNSREWTVPAGSLPVGAPLHIRASTDAGELRADVKVENESAPVVAKTDSSSAH
jgi:fimbrial chaperone protein